jgi:hypothetical protein
MRQAAISKSAPVASETQQLEAHLVEKQVGFRPHLVGRNIQ